MPLRHILFASSALSSRRCRHPLSGPHPGQHHERHPALGGIPAGGKAMNNTAPLQSIRRIVLFCLAAAALAGLASTLRSQDKAVPASKVERLNRAPVNKEALRVQLPRPVVATLPNGLTLVLLEDHKLPTVAFSMWIRPGQLGDPNELPGLASFTADMLREGTERRSSLQIAAEVDSLGATLAANARFGASYTVVNASGLAPNTAQILDLA